MKQAYKILLMLMTFVFIASSGFSQPNEIKVRFIANAGLHMTDGKSNIYIDFPYRSGFWMYSKYDKTEITNLKDSSIFIFTHKHPDHYSIRQVRKVRKKRHGKIYGPGNVKKLEQLSSSVQSFSIQPIKTKHRFSFHHYSYLITWHDKKIFISGDTEHAETIATLKNIDWAFMPAWVLMDAVEKKITIDAKMTGVYHIGPGDRITINNPKFHLMDKQGEIISIPY